jgi:AbiV family abortive infection protein
MEIYELLNRLVRTEDNLIQSADDLDMAINHIVQLLIDAAGLFMQGSYATSAFLSITACEEVAKAHIGSFTDGQHPEKTGRNMFRDHKTKHALAALQTVPMGKRLQKALSNKELTRIMNMVQNAGFVQIRENALYFQRENGELVTPLQKIDKTLSRSLVLFAIEVFDDALVGLTNHSMTIDKCTDALFEQVANA